MRERTGVEAAAHVERVFRQVRSWSESPTLPGRRGEAGPYLSCHHGRAMALMEVAGKHAVTSETSI
jgi:hypothetical protein